MSIFRLLIASLIFCFASFVHAGYMVSGVCYQTQEKAIFAFADKINSQTFQDRSTPAALPSFFNLDAQSGNISGMYYLVSPAGQYSGVNVRTFLLICDDTALNDAISLAWKIILVWLAAWAIAQLIRIVRDESGGDSGYGHS